MKILHTADWHFGKQLYRRLLTDEMQYFTDWLIEIIEQETIDILLISGDVFDITNPANVDKERYFSFLKRLREHQITTIITGGNHDSISFLNSSKEYLKQDNIFVVGGATEDIEEELLYVQCKSEQVVICAVPFLRDRDLRNEESELTFTSRSEAIRHGLKVHYQTLLDLAKSKYPKVPLIAMGHLFATGSSTSESEREIHIGNTGAVSHTIFEGFDYVALGHIHKPQIINHNEYIRYSGSPIPLSFSEKKDEKQVVVLTIENNKITPPKVIKTPKFRSLLRFTGTLAEVQQKLKHFDFSDSLLPPYIEIEINEMEYNLETIRQKDLFIEDFNELNEVQIISNKINFNKGSKNISELLNKADTEIEDLSPIDIFRKRLESELPNANEKERQELEDCFNELLEQLIEL